MGSLLFNLSNVQEETHSVLLQSHPQSQLFSLLLLPLLLGNCLRKDWKDWESWRCCCCRCWPQSIAKRRGLRLCTRRCTWLLLEPDEGRRGCCGWWGVVCR